MFFTKLRFVWNILAEMFIVFFYVRPVKNIPFKAYLSELNSLNPHDASKHNFASMQNYFISQNLGSLERKFPLIYFNNDKIVFHFSPTSCHRHPSRELWQQFTASSSLHSERLAEDVKENQLRFFLENIIDIFC